VGKLPNRRALRLEDSLRTGARERQWEGPQWNNSMCRSKNLAHRLNEGRSPVLEQRQRWCAFMRPKGNIRLWDGHESWKHREMTVNYSMQYDQCVVSY